MRFLLIALFTLFTIPASAVPSITQINAVNLTAAGTPQVVSATSMKCSCAYFNNYPSNVGTLIIGDSAATATKGIILGRAKSVVICAMRPQQYIDLASIYFNGTTTNDDLNVSCSTEASILMGPQ